MTSKVSRIIIESSIVFVSIFTTLSLLFGAISSDFKLIYYYLGYMLYYSLPFILACCFGILSMVASRTNKLLVKTIDLSQICFFLTGLMMVIWLASSAAQTYVFPTSYVYYMPYFSIQLMELFVFMLFAIFLIIPQVTPFIPDIPIPKNWTCKVKNWNQQVKKAIKSCNFLNLSFDGLKNRIKKVRVSNNSRIFVRWLSAFMLLIIFVACIVLMSSFGFEQKTSVVASGSSKLELNLSLNLTQCLVVNSTFDKADQISINLNSTDNGLFSYHFMTENNYLLFSASNSNPTTANQPIFNPVSINQDVGRSLRINTVINDTGTYYLVLSGNTAEGVNTNYEITKTTVDGTNQVYYFFISTLSLALFLPIAMIHVGNKETVIQSYVV
jgi:hypothetical protein